MALKRRDETEDEYAVRKAASEARQLIEADVPHNPEDEAYAIGVSLAFSKAAIEIVAKLTLSDFHLPETTKAFRALQAIVDGGETPTIHALALQIAAQAEDPGDPFQVIADFDIRARYDRVEFKDIRGIPGAVRRLKEAAMYREIIRAADKAKAMARTRDGDVDTILTVFDEATSTILEKKRRGVVWADRAGEEASEVYDMLAAGELVTVPSGIPELDEILYGGGFWGGDVIVVAGVTSGGKTTLSLNFGDNASSLDFRTLVFSLEMRTFKLFSRLHSAKALIPNYKIRPLMDNRGEGIRARLAATMGRVTRLPIGFVDWAFDITTIRRVAKDAVNRKGARLVIIDYVQLVRPPIGFKGSQYERVTEVSRQIKEMALELDVPVIVVSQLRRAYKEEKAQGNGNDLEPNLDMLKDSGGIPNDADTVIFIWGEKGLEGETEAVRKVMLRVAKQRQGQAPSKIVHLRFAPEVYTFKSVRQLEEAERQALQAAEASFNETEE